MRKYSWILGVLIMVLCIGFGISLPQIVFFRSMNRSFNQTDQYSIEPVEMGYSNTVLQAMRNCYDGDYEFNYQEDMANLSREQLVEICNAFLDELKLAEWGYDEILVNESNMKATCHLVVMNYDEEYRRKVKNVKSYPFSTDELESDASDRDMEDEENAAISTVIWRVEVEDTDNHWIVFGVDDTNQKVVQIANYAEQYDKNKSITYSNLQDMEPYVNEVILPFFQDYYQVDVEIIETGYWTCWLRLTDQNDDAIMLHFQNGQLEMIPIW